MFFMVDLASYYFHLSESLYYFKKNFGYTVMIKENCNDLQTNLITAELKLSISVTFCLH